MAQMKAQGCCEAPTEGDQLETRAVKVLDRAQEHLQADSDSAAGLEASRNTESLQDGAERARLPLVCPRILQPSSMRTPRPGQRLKETAAIQSLRQPAGAATCKDH